MRVLLAPGVFPPDSGGPATFTTDIGSAFVDRGHDVHIVTNGEADPGFDDRYQFDVTRIPRHENIVRQYAKQYQTLVREIRSFHPDVVLSNAFDLQAVLTARALGVPVATKIVGDTAWERSKRDGLADEIEEFQEKRYGPKITFLKSLRTLQTRAADRVFVPSRYLRSIVQGWGVPEGDIEVIYNSIDLGVNEIPLDGRARRIVTVGRLVNWKGVDGLIRAFESLATEDDNVELHIVGDGPERESLEARAQGIDASNRIEFHGRLPHEQVLDVMSHSRIFALNSTYEGLPHVALEAMACGTPVVLSDAGGNPEVVEDGESGCLVAHDDISAFVERFETLLSDPDRWESMRSAAFERLDERFDPDRMVSRYLDELRGIASAAPDESR